MVPQKDVSGLLLLSCVLLLGDGGAGGVSLGQAYILPPSYPSMVSNLNSPMFIDCIRYYKLLLNFYERFLKSCLRLLFITCKQ
jgi:hypothetical protein